MKKKNCPPPLYIFEFVPGLHILAISEKMTCDKAYM